MKPILYVLLCCTTSLCAQSTLPDGKYIGHLQLSGQTHVLRIDSRNDSLFIRLPGLAPEEQLLADQTGAELRYSWRHENWQLTLDNQAGHRHDGRVQRESDQGRFQLFRLATDQAIEAEAFSNNYIINQGQVISIWSQRGRLQLHAPISGAVSQLHKISDRQFISSAGELITFSELQAGRYRRVQYQYLNGAPVEADLGMQHTVDRREVLILGDTVGLSLYTPEGTGPFPACIIPMGAANYERWIYIMEARILAAHGIATLIYDNYGSGKSGGTLQDKTFTDKRDQAVALHAWLAEQPKIQPDGIGFRGGSQGGRLSLMAAARVPNTAFVVALSAPLETRLDQQLFAFSAHHRQRGFPEEAIARNADLWRRFFQAVANQKTDPSIDPSLLALRESHPGMILPRPTNGEVPALPWAADLKDDGRAYLDKINCPVLALYGTEDDRVPARRSAHLLREGLTSAGKQPPEIILYPGAGHSFQLPGQRIVPGLFMDQVRFIQSVTTSK